MDKGLNFTRQSILLNETNDALLADKGYAIFPMLNEETIARLTDYYFESQHEIPEQFYSSTHSKDYDFRKRTSDFLKGIISPLLSNIFKDYRLLGGAFVVKPPNGKGLLPPHQDWNIVDETKGRSYNLWIPLTNVSIENGAVFVLDASHRKIDTYRGPGIPSIFKDIEKTVWESLTPLPMKAGEALFYDHALLHASPVNQTDKIRLGIVCGVIPTGLDMQLCFNVDGKIAVHEATEEFFLEKDPMQGPAGLRLLNKIQDEFRVISDSEFKSIFIEKGKLVNNKWYSKIWRSK